MYYEYCQRATYTYPNVCPGFNHRSLVALHPLRTPVHKAARRIHIEQLITSVYSI
jgi:hypothetical protein